MKSWTEIQIGIVYYTGICISFIVSILSLVYLRPIGAVIAKIVEKSSAMWSKSFTSTLLVAGVIAAMAVSFEDCDGDYRFLLGERDATLQLGLLQISAACMAIATIVGTWFLIFVVLQLFNLGKIPNVRLIKVLLAVFIILFLFAFYERYSFFPEKEFFKLQ